MNDANLKELAGRLPHIKQDDENWVFAPVSLVEAALRAVADETFAACQAEAVAVIESIPPYHAAGGIPRPQFTNSMEEAAHRIRKLTLGDSQPLRVVEIEAELRGHSNACSVCHSIGSSQCPEYAALEAELEKHRATG